MAKSLIVDYLQKKNPEAIRFNYSSSLSCTVDFHSNALKGQGSVLPSCYQLLALQQTPQAKWFNHLCNVINQQCDELLLKEIANSLLPASTITQYLSPLTLRTQLLNRIKHLGIHCDIQFIEQKPRWLMLQTTRLGRDCILADSALLGRRVLTANKYLEIQFTCSDITVWQQLFRLRLTLLTEILSIVPSRLNVGLFFKAKLSLKVPSLGSKNQLGATTFLKNSNIDLKKHYINT